MTSEDFYVPREINVVLKVERHIGEERVPVGIQLHSRRIRRVIGEPGTSWVRFTQRGGGRSIAPRPLLKTKPRAKKCLKPG